MSKEETRTEKKEEKIYLNVNPLCNDLQVIHVESTLGFNIMLYAQFKCSGDESNKSQVKVNKVTFFNYPMHGLISFGIKDVVVVKEPKHKFRVIKILMGAKTGESKFVKNLTNEDIIWKYDEIIDNEITFDINDHIYTRDLLAASNPLLNYEYSTSSLHIPVGGRPCQFKLVKA